MKFNPQLYSQFPLDDGSIIMRQSVRELFVLNTTGSQLWQQLLEGQTAEQIASQWASDYGIQYSQVLQDIQTTLHTWQQQGLRDGIPVPNEPVPAPATSPHRVAVPPCGYRQDYRLGVFDITLYCNRKEIAETVHKPMAAFAVNPVPAPVACFNLFEAEQGYWLCKDDKILWQGTVIDTVINGLFYELLQVGVSEIDWLVALHAGAVSKDGTVIALSGIGGTGKSTLTAALLSRGFSYWGDDIILIEQDSLCAVPLPTPMTIKEGSWALLDGYYPNLRGLPTYQRLGRPTRYLPPPQSVSSSKIPLAYLVFPRVSATEPAQLRPISQLEALQRLLAANSSLPQTLTPSTVNQLTRWLRTVPAFELVYHQLETGMDIIERELL
ncbi:PqqD family peptide modification chaperone [Crenothrix polyspora]|uniref:HPr kinase n=1 Tax=Crenothrix polyspora TaxID=360316 RepID=A0A1R4H2D2_9GAMM|nr:PqqD family peptide modification chaperone [Crenothrix polyspora]SJM90414.1 hypothetical protein CRENPOLYSF1_1430002 [Crenothrix polyspora]